MIKTKNHGEKSDKFYYYIKENYFYMTKIATRDIKVEKTSQLMSQTKPNLLNINTFHRLTQKEQQPSIKMDKDYGHSFCTREMKEVFFDAVLLSSPSAHYLSHSLLISITTLIPTCCYFFPSLLVYLFYCPFSLSYCEIHGGGDHVCVLHSWFPCTKNSALHNSVLC